MEFSLINQGNNNSGTGKKSEWNEEMGMQNANTNIQSNTVNSGALVIKNSMKLLGGLALAAMVAMAATFGSVSADSPSKSNVFVAHGPNEMDIEYLNKLGAASFSIHGPNEMDIEYLNKLGATSFSIHGPNEMDIEYLNKLGSSTRLSDDLAAPSSMASSLYQTHGPDADQLTPISG